MPTLFLNYCISNAVERGENIARLNFSEYERSSYDLDRDDSVFSMSPRNATNVVSVISPRVDSDRANFNRLIRGWSEAATNKQALLVIADPGYYKGEEIVECYEAGITALVPKTNTSGSKAKGRFSKANFRYDAKAKEYICPAGERLSYRYDSHEKGQTLWVYWTNRCSDCPLKADCTTGKERRIKRWGKEHIPEAADALLQKNPDAMRQRKRLVEHPFGTIKHRMGSTHFLTKPLPNVQAEMSLYVLTYNLMRSNNILGTEKILEQLQAA